MLDYSLLQLHQLQSYSKPKGEEGGRDSEEGVGRKGEGGREGRREGEGKEIEREGGRRQGREWREGEEREGVSVCGWLGGQVLWRAVCFKNKGIL